MYKIGEKLIAEDYAEYMIVQAARKNAKKNKICVVCLFNGENTGRVVEVSDYYNINKVELQKAFGNLKFTKISTLI